MSYSAQTIIGSSYWCYSDMVTTISKSKPGRRENGLYDSYGTYLRYRKVLKFIEVKPTTKSIMIKELKIPMATIYRIIRDLHEKQIIRIKSYALGQRGKEATYEISTNYDLERDHELPLFIKPDNQQNNNPIYQSGEWYQKESQ